ncbi:MAG: hypothetical protein UR98_C0036G0008 [Parcubacteria group bacterium GW2011_GWA1_36_12]|nr:MAG: hypothetical protein UR98_C0036G0008 [Parcubacteria group bacterium GW2011_GWA1_36_12]
MIKLFAKYIYSNSITITRNTFLQPNVINLQDEVYSERKNSGIHAPDEANLERRTEDHVL